MTFRGDLLKLKYLDASVESCVNYGDVTHMKTVSKWNLCLCELMGCPMKKIYEQGASIMRWIEKKYNKSNCFVSLTVKTCVTIVKQINVIILIIIRWIKYIRCK